MYMEKFGAYSGNIEMTDISVHLLYEDQITQPLTITVTQTETEKAYPCFRLDSVTLMLCCQLKKKGD
jgi:hypothetical protein